MKTQELTATITYGHALDLEAEINQLLDDGTVPYTDEGVDFLASLIAYFVAEHLIVEVGP